jgi:GT2 family glycosyltransferase
MRSADPPFTVIVPTRGRPEQLRRCLAALLALEPAGGETELIVVDDDPGGSAAPVLPADRNRITYIRSQGRGPAVARNLGALGAHGEVLAFTDDDCEPAPGWLRELAATLAASGAEGAAGRTVNGAAGACSEASQLVVSALRRTARHAGGPAFVASNNVCFRREPFLELGGFDESFPLAAAEDRDLCERWIEAGHRFADSPRAVVVHRHRLSLPGFWRQHFRYGQGAFDFHELRRRRGRKPLGLQPEFYRALGREVREANGEIGRARLAGLAAISQAANASGYAAALIRAKL